MGLSSEAFTSEDLSAAFAIRAAAENLARKHPVLVLADPHEMLANAGALVAENSMPYFSTKADEKA